MSSFFINCCCIRACTRVVCVPLIPLYTHTTCSDFLNMNRTRTIPASRHACVGGGWRTRTQLHEELRNAESRGKSLPGKSTPNTMVVPEDTYIHLAFYMGARDPNSSLYVCMANTSLSHLRRPDHHFLKCVLNVQVSKTTPTRISGCQWVLETVI